MCKIVYVFVCLCIASNCFSEECPNFFTDPKITHFKLHSKPYCEYSPEWMLDADGYQLVTDMQCFNNEGHNDLWININNELCGEVQAYLQLEKKESFLISKSAPYASRIRIHEDIKEITRDGHPDFKMHYKVEDNGKRIQLIDANEKIVGVATRTTAQQGKCETASWEVRVDSVKGSTSIPNQAMIVHAIFSVEEYLSHCFVTGNNFNLWPWLLAAVPAVLVGSLIAAYQCHVHRLVIQPAAEAGGVVPGGELP